jgi:hypothetical protein
LNVKQLLLGGKAARRDHKNTYKSTQYAPSPVRLLFRLAASGQLSGDHSSFAVPPGQRKNRLASRPSRSFNSLSGEFLQVFLAIPAIGVFSVRRSRVHSSDAARRALTW